ncbi:MAG: YtxH domain-containing protein [Actinomycetota bacterium]|nr:YtxH domain-containing protein [Actinomycetota bacterium]MDQ3575212.1 YtxH domain-containing protein [Actinomycetota bacterium]
MIRRLFKKMTRLSLLGAAVGAVAYFLDPRSGRGRRTRAKDQVQAKVRRTAEKASATATHVENKIEGFSSVVSQPGGEAPEDDKTLVDKIKSEVLGGADYAGLDVVVDAAGGVVALRGQVERPEQIEDLAAAVSVVPGVRDVENHLHVPGAPPPNKQDSLDT